jgi:hypothetical protein
MVSDGSRVNTPLGVGVAVGKESFYDGKLQRTLVRLDDPYRWAFGSQTDVAAFFDFEVTPADHN